ncbi:unnamed protein product [Musa acuminata subsp. burmannicoides]
MRSTTWSPSPRGRILRVGGLPLRSRQGGRPLVHRQLPRDLRPLRLQRLPLQPREPLPRPELRHPHESPVPSAASALASRPRSSSMRLQQDAAGDYVVATEESHTVEEFLQAAFGYAGLNWKDHVVMDPKCFRPAEVDSLRVPGAGEDDGGP